MPTAVSTPGGLTANSYANLSEAQAIVDETPNTSAWGTNTDAQEVALIYATRMLDALRYKGFRTLNPQPLSWPRISVVDPDYGGDDGDNVAYKDAGWWGVYLNSNVIPKRVQRACVMLALEVLRAGVKDVWGKQADYNKVSKSVDVLHTTFVAPSHQLRGLRYYPSVWREIGPLTMSVVSGIAERA